MQWQEPLGVDGRRFHEAATTTEANMHTTAYCVAAESYTIFGRSRHVDASMRPASHKLGPPGNFLQRVDGWLLFYARSNDSLQVIDAPFCSDTWALASAHCAKMTHFHNYCC